MCSEKTIYPGTIYRGFTVLGITELLKDNASNIKAAIKPIFMLFMHWVGVEPSPLIMQPFSGLF
jgi:hypothetical protein